MLSSEPEKQHNFLVPVHFQSARPSGLHPSSSDCSRFWWARMSCSPRRTPVRGVVDADQAFIRNTIRGEDRFISAEKTTSTLHHKLRIKAEVKLLSGSRSRQLLCSDVPWVRRDKEVVRRASFVRSAAWNETMFHNLFHSQAITRMTNQTWKLPHQLWHQVRSQVCAWQLGAI